MTAKRYKNKLRLPNAFCKPPELIKGAFDREVRRNHALLINPFYRKDPNSSFGKHVLTPTLALTSVAASTPNHWDVRIWDENLLQGHPPFDFIPEIVGITVHLTFADRAFELAKWYQDRGAVVVLGGLHVQACPEECAEHADVLVMGEGVRAWGELITDYEQGDLQSVYEGSYRHQYKEEPHPRRELLDRKQFLTTTSMISTRGCHNRCNFCYLSTEGMHMPYQMLDVEQVVKQIVEDKAKYVVFTDNNLGSKPKYLYQLCDVLEPLEIIWSCAVSIDVTNDPILVRTMAQAGCTGVFVGFESLNEDSIIATGKRTPLPDDYSRRVKLFHDVGIQVNGSFVLGFDHDQSDVFDKTISWIEDNKLESANFQILTPYPGTPLFREMEKEGRILHRDWARYDTGHVVFQPKNMTVDQLQKGYEQLYQRQNSFRSIWRRRPKELASLLPYFVGTLLYRKSNWLWYFLIKNNLTNRVWDPLVEMSRRRHIRYRKRLN